MNLESRRPSGPLFRVGRDDEAWAIPDWAYDKEDGTFGNRYDDPRHQSAVSGLGQS
jgi:predicted NUDIX family NTP pyrophosphohydrolase